MFQAAVENARDELRRSNQKLAFSGIAGGLTMGLTGLSVAAMRSLIAPGESALIPYLLYPIGFIAVIIGRAQLFTENTLYPVVLVLDERKHVRRTLRLWGVVFTSNIFGAFMFALLAVKTPALRADILSQLIHLGEGSASGSVGYFFWSGIIGGWLIALVAWTVTASHWTIGQVVMVYMLTFIVGIGRFAHCVAGSGEILSAVMAGTVSLAEYLRWLMPATLGNICGGILMVSLLNYGQVKNL
ncbi:MAG TPA: formate/nitrite transporter family protein [Candidatus Aquilonibacter sp.]|nr:formate/nitrite transporter family protein [Candidatus Aquilonibacter sp.]